MIDELTLPGHRIVLRPGAEFSVQPKGPGTKRTRCRFHHAMVTPKGYELHAWTEKGWRAFRPEHVAEVHSSRKLPAPDENLRPPARRRAR